MRLPPTRHPLMRELRLLLHGEALHEARRSKSASACSSAESLRMQTEAIRQSSVRRTVMPWRRAMRYRVAARRKSSRDSRRSTSNGASLRSTLRTSESDRNPWRISVKIRSVSAIPASSSTSATNCATFALVAPRKKSIQTLVSTTITPIDATCRGHRPTRRVLGGRAPSVVLGAGPALATRTPRSRVSSARRTTSVPSPTARRR